MRRYALLAAALLATACAPQRPHFRHGGMGPRPGMGMGMGARNLFVSPAGEPFRAAPGAPAPMRAWFDQADADHDGALTWAEFEGDFTRYFALLDADHDGEIGPAEVTRYETEILPEMASRGGGGGFGGGGGGFRGRGGGGAAGAGAGEMAMMAGAARFGLLPIPHPIMAADDDFNRGISLAEFRHAAAQRFEMLDDAHNGRLTFAELAARRAQAYGRRGGRGAPPPQREQD